jgi:fructose-specific phosphotransferase system IIC component
MSLSNLNFENSTVVASALVAEIRQTRPAQTRVPDTGVQVQILPSALRWVSIVLAHLFGSLVKWLITLGFYP